MNPYPRSLRVAFFGAVGAVPLAVLAVLAISAPPDQTLDRLAPLGAPYVIGALIGLGYVLLFWARGKLSAPVSRDRARLVSAVVLSISVPAALVLSLVFHDDPRPTIAMLGLGFLLPLVPVEIYQIVHHIAD